MKHVIGVSKRKNILPLCKARAPLGRNF